MYQIITTEPEGNAFGIMARVQRILKQLGKSKDDIDKAIEKMKAGDYDHLCDVAEQVTEGELEIIRTH